MESSRLIDKIDLENRIFALAAQAGKEVFSCKGILIIVQGGAVLHALLDIYNSLYGAENKRLLQEEIDVEGWFAQKEHMRYIHKCKQLPLGVSFYLHIS